MSWSERIRSSTLAWVTSRTTCTVLRDPIRWTRARRCSRRAGFQGRSRLITTSAACRLRPRPPASVLTNTAGPGAAEIPQQSGAVPNRHAAAQVEHRNPQPPAKRLDPIRHVRPFGEDHRLPALTQAEVAEGLLQLEELGHVAVAGLDAQHVGTVATAPRDHQKPLDPLEISRQQDPPRRDPRHLSHHVIVGGRYHRMHRDEHQGAHALRKLKRDILLPSPEERAVEPRAEAAEVSRDHHPPAPSSRSKWSICHSGGRSRWSTSCAMA